MSPFKWVHAPVPSDADRIKILGGWAEANINSFACEELERWTGKRARIVTLNMSVKESFLSLWKAWEKEGALDLFRAFYAKKPSGVAPAPLTYDGWSGAYNPRYKRGVAHDQNPNHLSNHASGHAFDIAAQRYPLNVAVAGPDPIQLLVPTAAKHGWRWGGSFGRPDGMHFQHESSPFT